MLLWFFYTPGFYKDVFFNIFNSVSWWYFFVLILDHKGEISSANDEHNILLDKKHLELEGTQEFAEWQQCWGYHFPGHILRTEIFIIAVLVSKECTCEKLWIKQLLILFPVLLLS